MIINGMRISGTVYKKSKKPLNLEGVDREGNFRQIDLTERELPQVLSQWKAAGIDNLRLFIISRW